LIVGCWRVFNFSLAIVLGELNRLTFV